MSHLPEADSLPSNRPPGVSCRVAGPLLCPLAVVLALSPAALAETLVRECNLLRLERDAATILHGRCIARREAVDGRPFPYTEYEFHVVAAVKGCRDAKGRPLETLTFRQPRSQPTYLRPDGTQVVPLRFDLPTYRVGDEVLLFLTRESRLGLCAPVGLHQGAFRVRRRGNRIVARNRFDNAGLFERVEPQAFDARAQSALRRVRARPDRMELKDFFALCRGVKR